MLSREIKVRARSAIYVEVSAGRLVAKPCEGISWNGQAPCRRMPTHAHHEDYSKPLEVVWLCSIHHAGRHSQLRKNPQAPLRLWRTP